MPEIARRGYYRYRVTDVYKELQKLGHLYPEYPPLVKELIRLENLIRQFKDDRHEPWLNLATEFGISYVCVCGLAIDWHNKQEMFAWTWVNLSGHLKLDGTAANDAWATWPWYPDIGEVYRTSAWGREQVALKLDAEDNPG
jgi:hypothetical protein